MIFCTAGSDEGELMVNSGTHVLSLFSAPVPDVRTMITGSSQSAGPASVKLSVSVGNPRASSATTSEESDSEDDDENDAGVDEVSGFSLCCLLSLQVTLV